MRAELLLCFFVHYATPLALAGIMKSRSGAIREKALRMRSGWRYDWYDPRSDQTIVVHEVIRGSFVSPQLVEASPFVFIASGEKSCESTSSCIQIAKPLKGSCRCANLRRGIPDPWAEYVTLRGVREASARVCPQEVNLWADNLFLTESMWQKWGLPFGQGIPDPWRNWPKVIGWRSKTARKRVKEKQDVIDRSEKRTGEEYTCAIESRSPKKCPHPVKESPSLEESNSANESCGTKLCSQNLKMNEKPTVNRNLVKKQTCATCKCDSPCGPIRKQQERLRPRRQPCERVYKKNVPNKNGIYNNNCESPLTAMASNEFRVQNVRTKYASYPEAIHLTYSPEMQSICPKNDNEESNRTSKREPNRSELLARIEKLRAKSSSTESFPQSSATRKLNNIPGKCMCNPVFEKRKNNSTEIYKCKCQCSRTLDKCVSPENHKRNAIPGNMTVKCAKPHTVTCCPDTARGKKDLRDFEKCLKRDTTLQENNVYDLIANRNQANFYSSCPRTQQRRCSYCKYEYKEKHGIKLGTTLSPDKIDLKCNICNCNIHNSIDVVYDKIKKVNHKHAPFNDDDYITDCLYENRMYPKYKLSACTYKKKARCRFLSFQRSNKGKGKRKGNGKKRKGKRKPKRKKKKNKSAGNVNSLSPGTYYRLVRRGCSSFGAEGAVRLSKEHVEPSYRHRELVAHRNIDRRCQFCGCNITEYEGNHVLSNDGKITLPVRNERRELPCPNHPARASEGLNGKPENVILRTKRKRNGDERESGYRLPYLHDTDSGEMGDISGMTMMSYLSTEGERKIRSDRTNPLTHSSRLIDNNPTSPQLAQEKYVNSLNDHRKKYAQGYNKDKYYMKEINNSKWSNFCPEETSPTKKPVDVEVTSWQVMWKAPVHNSESEEYARELAVRNEEKLKLARPYYLKPSNFVMPYKIPLCDREMKQNDGMTNDEVFLNRKSIASTERNTCGEVEYEAADRRMFGTGNSSTRGQRLSDTYSRNGRSNIYHNLSEVLRESNNVPVDSTTFREWLENDFSNKEKEIKHYHYEEVPGEDMTKIQPTGNNFPAKETIANYLTVNYKWQDPSIIIDEENKMNMSSLHIKNKTLPEYNPFNSIEDNETYATEISKTWPELQCAIPRLENGHTVMPLLREKGNDRSNCEDIYMCTSKVQRGFRTEENVKLSAQESKYKPGKKITLNPESQSICDKGRHNLQQPYEFVTSLNEKGNGDEIPSRKKLKDYKTLRRENKNVQDTIIISQSLPLHNEENIQPLSDAEKQPKYKGSKLDEVDQVMPESSSLARKLEKIYPSRVIGDNVIKYPEEVPEDRVSKLEDHTLISVPPNEGNEMFAVKFNSFLNEFRTLDGNQLSHLRVKRPVGLSPEVQCKKVTRRNLHGNINDSDAFLLERSSITEKFSTENNTVDNESIHRRMLTSCSAPAERNHPLSNISSRNCNEIGDEFSSTKQCAVKRETSNSSPKPSNEKRMPTSLACGVKGDTELLVSEMDERKQKAVTERTLSGRKVNSPETREVEKEVRNFNVFQVPNKDCNDHFMSAKSELEEEGPHYSGTSPRKIISKNLKVKELTLKSTTTGRTLESSEVEEEIRSVDLDNVAGTSQAPVPASDVQGVLDADKGLHLRRKENKDISSRTRKLERTASVNTSEAEEGIIKVVTYETDRSNPHFIQTENQFFLNKSSSLSSDYEPTDRPQKETRVRKYGVLRRSAKFTSPPGVYNSPIPGLPSAEEFEPAVPSSEETIIKNIVYE